MGGRWEKLKISRKTRGDRWLDGNHKKGGQEYDR